MKKLTRKEILKIKELIRNKIFLLNLLPVEEELKEETAELKLLSNILLKLE